MGQPNSATGSLGYPSGTTCSTLFVQMANWQGGTAGRELGGPQGTLTGAFIARHGEEATTRRAPVRHTLQKR
jgi:hypothetical protein